MEEKNNDWAFGLVIALIVTGGIFFVVAIITAVLCCKKQKKSCNDFKNIDCFKRFMTIGKKPKGANFGNNLSGNTILQNDLDSETTNSTNVSTVSLSASAVSSLRLKLDEPDFVPNPSYQKLSPTQLSIATNLSDANMKRNTLVLKGNACKNNHKDTLVLNGNTRESNKMDTLVLNGRTKSILSQDNRSTVVYIDSIEDIFNEALKSCEDETRVSGITQVLDLDAEECGLSSRHVSNTSNNSSKMAQQLCDVLNPQQSGFRRDSLTPQSINHEQSEIQYQSVEKRHKVKDEPIELPLASAVDTGPADVSTCSDHDDKSNPKYVNPKLTLIRSKRGSIMPSIKPSRDTVSILTEEKWDKTVDTAFEDLF